MKEDDDTKIGFFTDSSDFRNIIQRNPICLGNRITITKSTHGKSSFCFFVSVPESQFIFKFPRTMFSVAMAKYEQTVTDYLRGKIAIEIPKIEIFHDGEYIYSAYKAIEGTNMSDVSLNENDVQQLCQQLAQYIVAIHSIPISKISFDIPTKANSILFFCKDFDYKPNFASIEDILSEESVIHGDYHRSNILLNQEKHLCGVLDFATFSKGSIYFDIGQMCFSMNERFNKVFIQEYEKASGKKVDISKITRVVAFLDEMINNNYLPFIRRTRNV